MRAKSFRRARPLTVTLPDKSLRLVMSLRSIFDVFISGLARDLQKTFLIVVLQIAKREPHEYACVFLEHGRGELFMLDSNQAVQDICAAA